MGKNGITVLILLAVPFFYLRYQYSEIMDYFFENHSEGFSRNFEIWYRNPETWRFLFEALAVSILIFSFGVHSYIRSKSENSVFPFLIGFMGILLFGSFVAGLLLNPEEFEFSFKTLNDLSK